MKKIFQCLGLGLSVLLLLSGCGNTTTDKQAQEAIQANSGATWVNVKESLTGPSAQLKNHYGPRSQATTQVSSTLSTAVAQKVSQDPKVALAFSNDELFLYSNINGLAVMDEDIVVAASQDMPGLVEQYAQFVQDQGSGISAQANLAKNGYGCGFWCWLHSYSEAAWPNGKIYFRFDSSVTSAQRDKFNEARLEFNKATKGIPIFLEGNNPNGATMKVSTGQIGGFNGAITPPGYADQNRLSFLGLPSMLIASSAYDKALIVHEMGHAAGLMHEHQRCDRDNYVSIDYNYFADWGAPISGAFNYNKLCNMSYSSGPFDYGSIMNYSAAQYVKPKQPVAGTVQNRDYVGDWTSKDFGGAQTFSQTDIDYGLRVLYPGTPANVPAPGCGNLLPGDQLKPGESETSCSGNTKLIYQHDGNLVIYRNNQALWASGTVGTSLGIVAMQPDGNLVIYNASNQPVWSSGTYGYDGAFLAVQDDGNVVLYNGTAVWSTNTWQQN